jgi:hypothetical protein
VWALLAAIAASEDPFVKTRVDLLKQVWGSVCGECLSQWVSIGFRQMQGRRGHVCESCWQPLLHLRTL